MQMTEPRYTMPSRKHLTITLIPNKVKEVDSILRAQLKNTSSVCITVDMWSNQQMKGFIGITGHYILN
ncbi:hypothetical protein EB796_004844 [Bugula neritina]|uniref:Uncharacterized protein n=1 Tax=Bugula neritina TaxID=10212 RepID=A0A7J7KGS6_BUGNE|nr:hypothetical protein EB796_004844 [Bugula neritina]